MKKMKKKKKKRRRRRRKKKKKKREREREGGGEDRNIDSSERAEEGIRKKITKMKTTGY